MIDTSKDYWGKFLESCHVGGPTVLFTVAAIALNVIILHHLDRLGGKNADIVS